MRGCIDQSNTLRLIVEQSYEWKAPLYITFIDFERAFDALKREAIWKALANRRIPHKIIRLIKELYNNIETRILHSGSLSEPVRIKHGVKQGCPLSPLLFNIVLDDVMREITSTPRGIRWTITSRLEDLDYADDIALLAQSHRDMQEKINLLGEKAKTVGLVINTKKTKSLRINTTNNNNFVIDNTTIEDVQKFNYLGSIISTKGGCEEDIANRIKQARAAFARLWATWRSPHLSRNTKLRIFNACIKSTLLYGSETWHTNQKNINKIQVFLNKCLRSICKIFWPRRISNDELWQITREQPVIVQIRRRKWRWIGHTIRRPAQTIARQALEWNPQGKRSVGRPRITWRRTVEKEIKDSGKTWAQIKQMANNRVRWRGYVEALCSQRG